MTHYASAWRTTPLGHWVAFTSRKYNDDDNKEDEDDDGDNDDDEDDDDNE